MLPHSNSSGPAGDNFHLVHIGVIAVTVFALYLFSMPGTVVLEDDGYFILSSYYNGIAHPPGYPLYTLLGHLATYIPFGSIAARVHGLSASFGALGCVFLWLISYRLLPHRGMATVVALGYGFSRVFWSQAIIAEVYSLNVLLFFMLAWLCLRYRDNADGRHQHRLSLLLGLVYGLGLSNHWPLFILSTPLLLAWLWPVRGTVLRQLPVSVLGLLVGLLPYAWLVYRSQMQPEFSFYGPIESLREFWFYVSREGYAGIDQSASAGWWDKGQFMLFVLRETAMQFGPFGVVFVVWGVVRQWRHWPLSISVGLLLGYLGNTLVLIGLLGFDYDPLHEAIFRVYPLIAYGICAVWLGLGVLTLVKWLQERDKQAQWRLAPMALMLVIVATTLLGNVTHNYRANDTWAEDYARAILESLEQDAILFTYGDTDTGPIAYLRMIEQVRPDITLYSAKGQVYNNRLFQPFQLNEQQIRNVIDNFITAQERPVYYTHILLHGFGFEFNGLYYKVLADRQDGYGRAVINQALQAYAEKILGLEAPTNQWVAMHRRLLLTDYCYMSALLLTTSGEQFDDRERFEMWVENVCNTFQGKMAWIKVIEQAKNPDMDKRERLVQEAIALREQAILKSELNRINQLITVTEKSPKK